MRQLLIDLTKKTMALAEPGLRLIDAETGEHVASVLPDDDGFYDTHTGAELARAARSYGDH